GKWTAGLITNQLAMAEALGINAPCVFVFRHDPENRNTDQRVTYFRNEQQLETALATAQRNNQMPIILEVAFTNNPNGGNGRQFAGSHVVTIRSYQPGPPARVEFDDQVGSGRDRLGANALSISDVYQMTIPPTNFQNVDQSNFDEIEEWWRIHGRP